MPRHESLPIFVYGTLRPGEKNYDEFLGASTEWALPARAEGQLFFLAEEGYPYVLPGPGTVRGEVIGIAEACYQEVLQSLDELEEYDSANESASVYLRRRTTVFLDSGESLKAWIYYWNRPGTEGKRIPGGDFRAP